MNEVEIGIISLIISIITLLIAAIEIYFSRKASKQVDWERIQRPTEELFKTFLQVKQIANRIKGKYLLTTVKESKKECQKFRHKLLIYQNDYRQYYAMFGELIQKKYNDFYDARNVARNCAHLSQKLGITS